MPGTTRYSATFDRTYEEEDRVDPSPPPIARRSRSHSLQANSLLDGTRPYTPLGGRPPNQRSSSTDNGPAKGPQHIPTRTVGKTAVKAHSNPFQFVKVGTCPLYKKAEDQLKKKEVKQPDVLKEEEEWQSNLDSWKSRRRKMSEDVFRRQEEMRQLEQLEEQANQANQQKKTKTFSEMVESRQHRGRSLSLCLISSPMELQSWEFESSSHKNGSCSSTFSGGSEENSTVNSDDEGVSLKGILDKSQSDLHNNHRTNGDSHIEKNGSDSHNGDYNKLSDLTTSDLQMKQKEGSYIDSGLESISSHRAGDTPDSGSDFSHDSGSSIDCESPRTGVNILEEFCTKPSQMSPAHEFTVKLCLNGKGQDFGFTFLGGKNEGQVIIASVLEGSKADSSSIHLGDQIIRIDGQELSSKKHIEIAGMIQKARDKGDITLLLWRHSKSPENGATNGFCKSESLPKTAVKQDKSEINSSKKESHQYEKSIESENEMFVDDFDELQKQSELLSASGKPESLVQANGNTSPSTRVVSNGTLSEFSSSSKPKSVVSNGFIEKQVKNAENVNSKVDNESEKKSDSKVQNKTRRKGVYSLNVSADAVQNSKEGVINSLFPLSPVTELPSPDEARTMASTLASSLTSVYNSQKENVSKEADAKSPLIKENNQSPVTANSKKFSLINLKAVSPQNETKVDSTIVPSSPSISKNTELYATEGSPQDMKPKLVLKKVKPKTKKVITSENTSPQANEVSTSLVPVSPTVMPTKNIVKDSKLFHQNGQNEGKIAIENKVIDTSKAMVNMPASTITETSFCKVAPSDDLKNNSKDENKNNSVTVTSPTVTMNGERNISVEISESAKPNIIRKKVKKIKKAPTTESVTSAPSQEAGTSSVPNSPSDVSNNMATKPPKEMKCIPSSEDKKVTVTNEHKNQNSSDSKISAALTEVDTSKNKIPTTTAVTASKDIATAGEIKKAEPAKSTTSASNGQESKGSTAFSQGQKAISNITTKKTISKPKENLNSSLATKPVCDSAENAKSPNSPTTTTTPSFNVSSSKTNEKNIESVVTPEMATAENEPKSSVNSQDANSKSPKKRNKSRSRKKNANSQKVNTSAKQTEEFKNVESLNIVFQSEPKNINSEKLNNVKNSEISCGSNKTSLDLVPDIPPVEKVAEEMEKLILEQLEEEERAKELASGLQIKNQVSSPEHLLIAPPKLAEPPKEKPPPPPSAPEGNQKDTSLKRVNSTKRIKKEICKRRSNFLGIDSAEGSLECSEPSIPPPPALEEILKSQMELDRQSRLQVESASTARLTLEEKEIMQREKEIIESLESEERQKMLLNSTQEFNSVSPSTVNDDSEEERIQYLKEERKRLEAERLISEDQQLQLMEEKQLKEREEFIRKQEADKSAVPLSPSSLSVATNVPNTLQPSLPSISANTQSSVLVSGSLGDGKSLILNSAPGNSSSEPGEKEKVPQKPAVPPKPLKKKEAIRKERERLRQEQEALVREREEHRRKLLQEQEELVKHQKSHALEAPVSRLGPLPPLVQPNFQPQLTSPPARDSASFPSRSCHGAQNGAAGSPNSAELMGPVVARQNRIPPPRKAVQQSDAWGQQKENENSFALSVPHPSDVTSSKALEILSSSKPVTTNNAMKEQPISELKANTEIESAKKTGVVEVKKVLKKKENENNFTESVPLPKDVTCSKVPEITSSSKPIVTNTATKEQPLSEPRTNTEIESAKKMSVVKVKKVFKEKENENSFAQSVPHPSDVTSSKASEITSSSKPVITTDAAKEQPISEPKANTEISGKKTVVVEQKKVLKKKENESKFAQSVPLPNDVPSSKAPEITSSSKPVITNDATKEQPISELKANAEIESAKKTGVVEVKEVFKKKENENSFDQSVPHPSDVTSSKAPQITSSLKPAITTDAAKEQPISKPKANTEIESGKKTVVVKQKKVLKKKENESKFAQSVPLPNDVPSSKAPEITSSSKPVITNDATKEQPIGELKANAEIESAKKTGVVEVKEVFKKKENESKFAQSVPLPNDVPSSKAPEITSSSKPVITNDATKEQPIGELKANAEIESAKKTGVVEVKEVFKKKENENSFAQSVPHPSDVTSSQATQITSSSKPVVTNNATKEQPTSELKANAEIESAKKTGVVEVKKVFKKKENENNFAESIPLPKDVTCSKVPEITSSSKPIIANTPTKEQPISELKANAEIESAKKIGVVKVKKVFKKKGVTSSKVPEKTSSSKPIITKDAMKEQPLSEPNTNTEVDCVKEEEQTVIKMKEKENNFIQSVPIPKVVTSSKLPEITSSSKPIITRDTTVEQPLSEPNASAEIECVKEEQQTVIIMKENENSFAQSVPHPIDVTSSKAPEITSSSKPAITTEAAKKQSISEPKANTEIESGKKTVVVKQKKVLKKKENENNSAQSVPLPNGVTSSKTPDITSSSKPVITNDATKEQPIRELKANIKIECVKEEQAVIKMKENENGFSQSVPHPCNVTSSKAPEITSSSKPIATNGAATEQPVNEPKANIEIESAKKTGVVKVKKVFKKKENGNITTKSQENGNNITKSVLLSNDSTLNKASETALPSKPIVTNDSTKEQATSDPISNVELDCVKKMSGVKIKKVVKKKENGNISAKSHESRNNAAKSIPLPNDVTSNKAPGTALPSETNIANDALKEQAKTEPKVNIELDSAKKMGVRKVKKVIKKKENGKNSAKSQDNENNVAKSASFSNDVNPNKVSETIPPPESNITNDPTKEQAITEPKANAEADSIKKKSGGKVKRVVKKKTPSVRKQNQDSLTESRYNQNHWLIQEAEMRRITELKERQRSCSQTHLAEDDVCSNSPRVPVIPPTHNQHLNFAVQDKMWNYNQPGVSIKKYPPSVVKEQLHTIYPRETVSQQPPMKPSRVVPMERKEHMLSVSGRKRCSHCNEELGRGAAMIIESLQLYYHIHCFQCCVCQAQLGNGSCGADVRVRNQKLHCNNCYSNDEAGLKFSQV